MYKPLDGVETLRLLASIKRELDVRYDKDLARILGVKSSGVTKMRASISPFSPRMIVCLLIETGWPIDKVFQLAGRI